MALGRAVVRATSSSVSSVRSSTTRRATASISAFPPPCWTISIAGIVEPAGFSRRDRSGPVPRISRRRYARLPWSAAVPRGVWSDWQFWSAQFDQRCRESGFGVVVVREIGGIAHEQIAALGGLSAVSNRFEDQGARPAGTVVRRSPRRSPQCPAMPECRRSRRWLASSVKIAMTANITSWAADLVLSSRGVPLAGIRARHAVGSREIGYQDPSASRRPSGPHSWHAGSAHVPVSVAAWHRDPVSASRDGTVRRQRDHYPVRVDVISCPVRKLSRSRGFFASSGRLPSPRRGVFDPVTQQKKRPISKTARH